MNANRIKQYLLTTGAIFFLVIIFFSSLPSSMNSVESALAEKGLTTDCFVWPRWQAMDKRNFGISSSSDLWWSHDAIITDRAISVLCTNSIERKMLNTQMEELLSGSASNVNDINTTNDNNMVRLKEIRSPDSCGNANANMFITAKIRTGATRGKSSGRMGT